MQSRKDSGSVFSIEIPLAETSATETCSVTTSPDEIDQELGGTSVLVIEDDIAGQQVLELTLSDSGCNVRTAKNAEEFYQVFDDYDPDIVIADYSFDPQMTGIDVISFVRQDTGFKVLAIIITGNTSKSLISDYREPVTDVLIKPIDAVLLRETMIKLLNWTPVI